MTRINTEQLRAIAENEPTHKWGPWAVEEDDWDESHNLYINDGGFGVSYIAQKISQGKDEGAACAEYLAAFNPETTLALLDRLDRVSALARKLAGISGNNIRELIDEGYIQDGDL